MWSTRLKLKESIGDIFEAKPNSILIHSVDCGGSWSFGIEEDFKEKYPEAFKQYKEECKKGRSACGKSLMIKCQRDEGTYFIGCLLVSFAAGRYKGDPTFITQNTKAALEELLSKITAYNAEHKKEDNIKEVRMYKINRALFRIRWDETKKMLKSIVVKNYSIKSINIVDLNTPQSYI